MFLWRARGIRAFARSGVLEFFCVEYSTVVLLFKELTKYSTRPNSRARTRTGKYSFSLFTLPRAGLATLPG